MPRFLPNLELAAGVEVETAWHAHTAVWARQRLSVIRLVAKHGLSAGQIAALTGVGRATVFRYLDKFQKGGVTELLHREHRGGKHAMLSDEDYAALVEELRHGQLPQAKDAQAWIKARTGRTLALSTLYTLIRKIRRGLKNAATDSRPVALFRDTAFDR